MDATDWVNLSDDELLERRISQLGLKVEGISKINLITVATEKFSLNKIESFLVLTPAWSLERLKLICYLCQPAVFFRRRVLQRFGMLDPRLHYCMDYEYWLRLAMGGARFVHVPMKLAASRLHAETKTLGRPREAHAEINDMLRERLGFVPDNWLSNYAYAVLDGRGIARATTLPYTARHALLTLRAAFRWAGFPSLSLLRMIASSFLRRPSIVPRRIAIDA